MPQRPSLQMMMMRHQQQTWHRLWHLLLGDTGRCLLLCHVVHELLLSQLELTAIRLLSVLLRLWLLVVFVAHLLPIDLL